MEYVPTFVTLFVTLILVAASPGPAFVMVSQQALAHSRRAGLWAALGMTVGSLLWVALVLVGIAFVLREAAWAYTGLRVAGGIYLIYLGIRMWQDAKEPAPMQLSGGRHVPRRAFRTALLVQMLNPKAAVFFGSIFLTMLPADGPAWVMPAALLMVAITEFGWYAGVAMALSSGPAKYAYVRGKTWIERTAGAALAVFGLKLAWTAR